LPHWCGAAEQPGPSAGESPRATLGRIRSYASTAAKLADSKDEYLSVIKARRQEEAAARKEREVSPASGSAPLLFMLILWQEHGATACESGAEA